MYLDRFSDPGRIPKDKSYGYCHKYEPAHSPVLDSREKRQLRHILRDSDSERIQHRSSKTYMRRDIYHAHACKVIISKRSGKRNDNGDKGGLLLQYDPLDFDVPFLTTLDGYAFVFFGDKEENRLSGAEYVVWGS